MYKDRSQNNIVIKVTHIPAGTHSTVYLVFGVCVFVSVYCEICNLSDWSESATNC